MTFVGFVADDLTGAADVLSQAHARGLEAALVLDPNSPLPDNIDVVGIAGPLRAMPADELYSRAKEGFEALTAIEPQVIINKVCSTFDSSPTVGSIGASLRAMRDVWPRYGAITVAPAQPEFGRYTCFGQHFAAWNDGIYRLDRHPVMACHPSTPMAEADLATLLRAQSDEEIVVGGISLVDLENNDRFARCWREQRESDATAFIADAVTPAHMDQIAEQLLAQPGADPALVVGSGGIMAALARAAGHSPRPHTPTSKASGPVLAVSASASPTTAAQIDDAIAAGWVDVPIPPDAFNTDLAAGEPVWSRAVAEALSEGRHVVVHTTRGPSDPRLSQCQVSASDVGQLIGQLAGTMIERGLTRDLAICGGDTSSHALIALNAQQVRVVEQFVNIGPICSLDDNSRAANCRVLLKGGQVGPIDILRRFAGTDKEERV